MSALDPAVALETLKRDGIAVLPGLIPAPTVTALYNRFVERVESRVSFNGSVGCFSPSQTHRWVDLPFTMDPACVDIAINETILTVLEGYLGGEVVLAKAVAYKSLVIPNTKRRYRERLLRAGAASITGFHSDQETMHRGQRYVAAMCYLNNVSCDGGGFEYVRGSHEYGSKKRDWSQDELPDLDRNLTGAEGPAGSVVLFDVDGVHRAGIPSDEPRCVYRCAYTQRGGYVPYPLIMSSDALPLELTPRQQRVLRFGERSAGPIPLSRPPQGLVARVREARAMWLGY